jgi:hypothetical protein
MTVEETVDNNFVAPPAYTTDGRRALAAGSGHSGLDPAARVNKGISLIVLLLCSLGLWAAIWSLLSSLF